MNLAQWVGCQILQECPSAPVQLAIPQFRMLTYATRNWNAINAILMALREKGRLQVDELARITGWSISSVRGTLVVLYQAGSVDRVKGKYGAHGRYFWFVRPEHGGTARRIVGG